MNWTSTDLDDARVAAIVDPHFARSLDAGSAPGMAYAVVSGGVVIHSSGLGSLALPAGPTPHGATVFRIASMTKSFTAAVLLGLRDDGQLSLDAPVVDYVPELAAGGAAARTITVRQLLTMGGGFLSDDPWGDRQQDLLISDFRSLVGQGLTPLWIPGLRFEYSNLGYALLGLVIEGVTGRTYREVVESRLLHPLGMASSGFDVDSFRGRTVASGYVRRSTGWVEEPIAGSGAFSPMGGLLSTINDLAIWVGCFQSAHGTELGAAQGRESLPLRPSSLIEMQVTQRLVAATAAGTAAGPSGAAPEVTGYGFGLFETFRSWGRSVYHSGGYPGFGSHMRWHPASGLGIVAIANGTYAPMSTVATAALGDLVIQLEAPLRPPAVSLRMLDVAQASVTDWLKGTDPDGETAVAVRALCADNVEVDVPWPERVAVWHTFRRSVGALHTVPGSKSRPSPGSVSWQMSGEQTGNRIRITVSMAPHDPRLIQSVQLQSIEPAAPEPPASTDWS
ncbi:MAG: beta-lactamase family protein [Actinomycetia bacterium]|nr:beta-lactamase family protein [Actinomycetes bacterium]